MKNSTLTLLLLGLILIHLAPSADARTEFPQNKLYFWREESQAHLWLSAAGTVIGSQTYQALGMERDPANVIAPIQVLSVAAGISYLEDEKIGFNDLAMSTLGVAMASVLNVTIHFNYFGKNSNPVENDPKPVVYK